MTPLKRVMDLTAFAILLFVLWPLIVIVALVVLVRDGRPVFYVSERMKALDRPFGLVKFRTMRTDPNDAGVSGGHKVSRITPTGRMLRRYRLDEMPQLWNVLKGDISFVGPRPPLRRYVEMFPDLYAEVLRNRPGLTGLASLLYHEREYALLAECSSAEETERVYVARCVPAKARLDILYGRRRTICWDVWIMFATVFSRMPARMRR